MVICGDNGVWPTNIPTCAGESLFCLDNVTVVCAYMYNNIEY